MCLAIITTGLEYTFRYWHNWTEVEEARLVAFLHRILAEAAQRGAVETIKDFVDADERSAEVIEQAAEALVAAARPVEAQVEAVVEEPKTKHFSRAGSKEARAGQVFKKPYIGTLKVVVNQTCPFEEEKYCEGSEHSARIFTTGLVDAKSLGINADRTPMLNRTTMCVPLNIDAGFVQKPPGDSSIGAWEYYLGPKGDHNETEYTFRLFGDPFDFDVRSYTMSTYVHEYGKSWEQNYWHPRAELNIRKGLTTKSKPHALTIMFVNSCRLFYQKASEDSIFPAQTRRPDGLYANYDSRARPLACIDWIEICTQEGECAHPSVADNDMDMPLVFTRYAMNKSTSYDGIFARGASALDAQSRIRGDVSLPLSESPPQWAVESEAIFETSLARIQYDAFDIASGAGSDRLDIYEDTLPPKFRGNKSCKLFTFQLPKGYHNLGFVQMILVQLILPLGVFLLGFETDQDFSAEKQKSGWFKDSKLTYFDWAWVSAGHILSWSFRSADKSNASATTHHGHGHIARPSSGDGQSQQIYHSIDPPARAGVSVQDNLSQAPAPQRLDEEVTDAQRASEASFTGQPTASESTNPEAPNLQPPSCTTASTGASAAQEFKQSASANTRARTSQQQTLKQMFLRQGQSESATAQRRTEQVVGLP
nr:hypothetical protein B0A51_14522 [Rachicladosporium sp. CCFEE 5018]